MGKKGGGEAEIIGYVLILRMKNVLKEKDE